MGWRSVSRVALFLAFRFAGRILRQPVHRPSFAHQPSPFKNFIVDFIGGWPRTTLDVMDSTLEADILKKVWQKWGGQPFRLVAMTCRNGSFRILEPQGKGHLYGATEWNRCIQTASEKYIRAAQQAGVKCGVKRECYHIIICGLRTCGVGRRRSRDRDGCSVRVSSGGTDTDGGTFFRYLLPL